MFPQLRGGPALLRPEFLLSSTVAYIVHIPLDATVCFM